MDLTADQKAAAHAPNSVAVTAGAGTGKTAMLAERYLHHVTDEQEPLTPLQIVAVTFTEKAANELRARIRKTIARKVSDPDMVAEVDASQISTIHALAARICRDFYHLADIPADFRILDETEGEMWRVAQIDAALEKVRPEIVEGVGIIRLRIAMKRFLTDPTAAEEALSVDEGVWKREIDRVKREAIDRFLESDVFIESPSRLQKYQGAAADGLEKNRLKALTALKQLAEGADPIAQLRELSDFNLKLGQKANWPHGGLSEIKEAIKEIREAARACLAFAELEFNEADAELARQVKLLAEAFEFVRGEVDREKKEARFLDYNDLETNALTILNHPEVRDHYRARWKAVMVDEFQDTNTVQAEIVRLITEDAKLTIVGDEKQSIYGFRGADVEVFGSFREEMVASGRGSTENLKRSFRTHKQLVEITNTIFEPILGDLHQPLDAERDSSPVSGPHITFHAVEQLAGSSSDARLNVEADNLSTQIQQLFDAGTEVFDKDLKSNRKLEYRDIAILCRAWAPLDVFVDALAAKGIPAIHAGGGNLLQTREAKDVFALLRFLADRNDDIAFVALLRSPFFAVSDKTLFEFVKGKEKEESWWNAVKRNAGELQTAFETLSTLVDRMSSMSARELVILADELTGYSAIIANLAHGPRREADWKGVLALLRDFERRGRDDVFSASRFIGQLLEFKVDVPRPRLDAGNAVQLMTVHASKGLEWPIVFIPSLTRRNKSHGDGIKIHPGLGVVYKPGDVEDEDGEIVPAIHTVISGELAQRESDEDKRVLYVALTRAQEKVFLSAASHRENEDMKILGPGLNQAGITATVVPYSDEKAVPPTPNKPELYKDSTVLRTESVAMGLNELHVTGLSDYLKCPKQFKLRHIDGHPGLREGKGNARILGVLTHLALEKDFTDPIKLKQTEPLANEEQAREALELANHFKTKRIYDTVRVEGARREVDLELERGGLYLKGAADLVADEFVLDFKTDQTPEPDEHSLQLWAYARALGKEQAYIAYLKNDLLTSFDSDELRRLDDLADSTIKGIVEGRFDAKPSPKACKFCHFGPICAERVEEE